MFRLENYALFCIGKLFRAGDGVEFQGKKLPKFISLHNHTFRNERCVEVAVVLDVLSRYAGADILEVGNVMAHYKKVQHDVIDKYEKGVRVLNVDITDYRPDKSYDLIISISTLEHVGFDDSKYGGVQMAPERSGEKIVMVVNALKNFLKPGGVLLFTIPLGYNPFLDDCVRAGLLDLTESYYYRKFGANNWQPVSQTEADGQPYSKSGLFWHANAILIGLFRKDACPD